MGNRLLDNVYILDTGSGNVSIPWNSGSRINAISWWFADSSGDLQLSLSNTTNVIFRQVHDASNNADQSSHAYLGVAVTELKLPVLTAGTAWIYFS